MPPFLYTVLIIGAVFWILFVRTIIFVLPSSGMDIAAALLLLFGGLTSLFSILFYFYFYNKAPSFTNLRLVYRRSLKWGAFLGLGVVVVLALRAFHLANIINLILFVFLYLGIFLQLKGKR